MTRYRHHLSVLGVALLATLTTLPTLAAPPEPDKVSYLMNRLASESLSAVIYHRAARCDMILQSWMIKGSPTHVPAATWIRRLFPKDLQVEMLHSYPKVVSIRLEHVGVRVFSRKIATLKLNRLQQYEPSVALGALESTAEFRSAEKENGLSPVFPDPFSYLGEPNESDPHLPPELRNVTLNQVADLIAKTFGGVVVYQECPSTGEFRLYYTGPGGRLRPS